MAVMMRYWGILNRGYLLKCGKASELMDDGLVFFNAILVLMCHKIPRERRE
jgi:hypothetical protein